MSERARHDMAEANEEELRDEIERLSFRQLSLYNVAGEEVFTMTIGPLGCGWTAGDLPINGIARVRVD